MDSWYSSDKWGSVNGMNDWGEGEGVLGYDACSRGEGSVLRGELWGVYTFWNGFCCGCVCRGFREW